MKYDYCELLQSNVPILGYNAKREQAGDIKCSNISAQPLLPDSDCRVSLGKVLKDYGSITICNQSPTAGGELAVR